MKVKWIIVLYHNVCDVQDCTTVQYKYKIKKLYHIGVSIRYKNNSSLFATLHFWGRFTTEGGKPPWVGKPPQKCKCINNIKCIKKKVCLKK